MINVTPPTQKTQMFLDPAGQPGIARYDIIKYPFISKLTKKLRATDWNPEEIDVSKDAKDFRNKLTEFEQQLFTRNIKRQIVLDTKQGSAPVEILGPIATLSDLKVFITKWSSNEDVHSESYTHIIKNIYPNSSAILDEVLTIEPILKCAESIAAPYDELDRFNTMLKTNDPAYDLYQHKKALWMCLNAINALEGIRFYVSFACSWAFPELKKMEGNASIIKLIARDENVHLAFTQQVIKALPQDDPDFEKIRVECTPDVLDMFEDVINQELDWADYAFEHGSMIGMTVQHLKDYVKLYLAPKRMHAIGVKCRWSSMASNPLPWTQKWISGSDVQVAPQEKQLTNYLIGTKRTADAKNFQGFEL